MEFPYLGNNCSERNCNRLDFLPMRCDACGKIFCSNHFSYARHSCLSLDKKDVQVPVCPLCSEPVPTPRHISPDKSVGDHIDQFCKSETKKIFVYKCSYKNCQRKELVPVQCSACRRNFCLRHRHMSDHECRVSLQSHASMAEAASSFTGEDTMKLQDHALIVQGSMTEDEALAQALALSIIELDKTGSERHNSQPSMTTQNENMDRDKCRIS
uniref:Putative arsenite inducuble rna associated protein aip-1 n=1 Tax=Tabanus bromius TaxID=304241 RepID=A0A0K8TNQ6_TABBR